MTHNPKCGNAENSGCRVNARRSASQLVERPLQFALSVGISLASRYLNPLGENLACFFPAPLAGEEHSRLEVGCRVVGMPAEEVIEVLPRFFGLAGIGKFQRQRVAGKRVVRIVFQGFPQKLETGFIHAIRGGFTRSVN